FFQAEDGIRDDLVTGVQTCALPIFEGLVMGTRSGDVDPGALLYVMERTGMSAAQMRRELNADSGLLGLSGRTADMRELLALAQGGDASAGLAIEIFCRHARHYVAAYM